ncbi:tail fiber domain-containing protein [Mucilaginibacter aquaedulcis]|uniref:tail fiber domain-containing protein n=1 Tax=Mucilaginibacter aquaedulcis TaxID=1187081 RepID=UPI0025B52C16|nr:tail fiber domain-containing protein [Mucilaginibacter aquaedulcis]MDN3550465.1 tail fiber domain-containing protein [Mucilaginibacter aquaedulcis]
MNFKVKTIILSLGIITAITEVNAQDTPDNGLIKNQAPVTNALNYINKLKPITYEFNRDKFSRANLPAGNQFGFGAEDLKNVLPGAVSTHNKWYSTGKNNLKAIETNIVDMQQLVPLLVGAIKDQHAEIQQLKARITQLEESSISK